MMPIQGRVSMEAVVYSILSINSLDRHKIPLYLFDIPTSCHTKAYTHFWTGGRLPRLILMPYDEDIGHNQQPGPSQKPSLPV
jgi:hypothetical protein